MTLALLKSIFKVFTNEISINFRYYNFNFSDITTIATSDNTVNNGEKFTFTCEFSSLPARYGARTVEWLKNDAVFINKEIKNPSDIKQWFTVKAASINENGDYQCKVTFGTLGVVSSAKVKQYVRYVTEDTTVYVLHGKTGTITCQFYGDDLSGATTWSKDGQSISDDNTYNFVSGNYANYQRTDKLEIKSATDASDGAYKCTTYYSADSVPQSSTQSLKTLG